MSITGLFLCIYLVVHLLGNLILFKNDQGAAFNQYFVTLSGNPFIRIIEVVLVFGFLFHIVDAVVLTLRNRNARPTAYALNSPQANSSWASRNMGITGTIILLFLIVHVNSFTVRHRIIGTRESMYETVARAFQSGWSGWYWAFYVVAMIFLGIHLNHGFQSAFRSIGLSNPKYIPLIKKIGWFFSVIIPTAFAAIPLYFFFRVPFRVP
jgi:succinate dehydrogenase / fumarate reductase cytochrome b subunit